MFMNAGTLNYCILIPTYNNEKTLEKVILNALQYTPSVIVVNDGSTDSTSQILQRLSDNNDTLEVVTYQPNRGKGAAIKAGFKRAEELGFEYAITVDSDGQHFLDEIPKFLAKVTPGSKILIIGNRDMTASHIPARSLFGRKFSNFWAKLETGRELCDTQSGYRLYTVAEMNKFHFFTSRYDFEVEALIRWVWRGYDTDVADIAVYYPPLEERVSHFKAFKDNFRISILNAFLVLITITVIMPRNAFRWLFRKR